MKFRTKDINVINFIIATGITGGTEFNAINYLVLALKNNNLWDRIDSIYPFVGGTDFTHKFNLKDPRDLDIASRLTFAGTITHNSNGVNFGYNGYANTYSTPSTTFTLNNETLCLYSRSSFQAPINGIDMGSAITTIRRSELIIRSNVDGCGGNINSTTNGSVSNFNTDGSGLYMATRVSATDLRLFKNGIQIGLKTTVNNGTLSNRQMYIGARNVSDVANGFTSRNFALAMFGGSFTPVESLSFYNIIQQYQTMLNRQV